MQRLQEKLMPTRDHSEELLELEEKQQ
jgi:hypothetical protein